MLTWTGQSLSTACLTSTPTRSLSAVAGPLTASITGVPLTTFTAENVEVPSWSA